MSDDFVHSSVSDATQLNFGPVTIDEYPRLTQDLGFAHFSVAGRRPSEPGTAYRETDCTFSLYVLDGSASMTVAGDRISISKGDLVTVRAGTLWSLEGTVEYVVATTPAFFPEQSHEVPESDTGSV